MKKSINSEEYNVFLQLLIKYRKQAGLTQGQLGELLGETQSVVSKIERGERRVDVVELLNICEALKISPVTFIEVLQKKLKKNAK